MRVLAGPGWHLRMSTELWVASTDVCEICGGLRNLRTSTPAAEWRPWRISTDFCGFWRSPADLGGILRSPSVFRWVCADACPTSVRGILFLKWSGCLTICELCCVPTSCPVYCWVLPLPVSPHPQKSTSKICRLLPVVTSNVKKKTKASNTKNGVSQNRGFPVPDQWFPWLRGTYRTLWPPPLHVEDCYPTRGYPDPKFGFGFLFSCLTRANNRWDPWVEFCPMTVLMFINEEGDWNCNGNETPQAPERCSCNTLIEGPPTMHHPHKRPPHQVVFLGGVVVVCTLSEPKKKGKIRTTPGFALAMLIVIFVGVVRGFRRLINS